ncbi:energy transducer TonB [Polynucleobacter sp. AP-Jannik-300A-C4]|uniref:energy transducer TonB family protein n=1 Tax=Polynucleobacter sp. AP-Jannik-300A-C4 TaxID=2576928 RepID=UPI001BFE9F3E|nr:energy transducer TonB [Polynucleobacter sp. AP-Jannik-300A-C4]QWE22632.1 energy transducer TonB [Polynucleobacter sp. AP-Jannik-300A-C4]
MTRARLSHLIAIWASIVIHLGLILLWAAYEGFIFVKPKEKNPGIIEAYIEQPITKNNSDLNASPNSDNQPTSLVAPSAPTAEEWAFASKYTLKNSKGYRHSFGQQVRSMMGTAEEGPDQGHVRFSIEIAPNGTVTKVETLWKTSDKAEQLARRAIQNMPSLPPTPTGKPLIFERTISFTPFSSNDAPIYRDDCLPDTPSFSNPFAWDGKSPQEIKKSKPAEKLSPEALAECLKQLPQDSIDGITAEAQRQLDIWSSGILNRGK